MSIAKLLLKDSLVYGVANAISRSVPFLSLFILGTYLSIEEFGQYSLILVLTNLCIPIISLNGMASIIREGTNNIGIAYYILRKYTKLLTLLFCCLVAPIFWIDSTRYQIYFYTILLGGGFAAIEMVLSLYRALSYSTKYVSLVCIKVGVLLLTILLSIYLEYTFTYFLLIQALAFGIVGLLYLSWELFKSVPYTKINLTTLLIFSTSLIPHSISQWIASSSDRLIIQQINGEKDLGLYSFTYTIGMLLLLINSAIALVVPVHMIQSYAYWENGKLKTKVLAIYSFLAIFLWAGIKVLIYFDEHYTHFFNYYEVMFHDILLWVYLGIYMLGIYVFYSSYLFFYKKALQISFATLITAITNICLTIGLTSYYGVVGAAWATFSSYILYATIIIYLACQANRLLLYSVKYDIGIAILTHFFIFIIHNASI